MAGVHILLDGENTGVVTDSAGQFRVKGAAPGWHTVTLSSFGHKDLIVREVYVAASYVTDLGFLSMHLSVVDGYEAIEIVADRPIIRADVTDSRRMVEGPIRPPKKAPSAVAAPVFTPPPLTKVTPPPSEHPPHEPPSGLPGAAPLPVRGASTGRLDKSSLAALSPTTELWIIERSDGSEPASEYAAPQLKAVMPDTPEEIPLPLRHTDVKGQVDAFIATVDVRQSYHNPYNEKIEAVYVFPLPTTAAVTDFQMIIGDRKIRGVIREREEAQRIYDEAKAMGYRAALLSQERPNVFTQRVANIEPGNDIDVQTTFFMPLAYDDGAYEFVFPTVVGPRFNPPGFNQGIGAVARGSSGISGQPVEVEYLKPGEMGGHHLSIQVDIDAGVTVEEVTSSSHAILVERPRKSRAVVRLSPNDRLPDKDFVLRYRTAGNATKTALMVDRGDKGDYFALFLQPPASLSDLPRMPREMVFVLDCSGSMHGAPLAKAKEAMRRCLKNLHPEDTFQIIRFSERASRLGPLPVPATPENVMRALRHVDELHSGGGTMMIEGIKAALDFPHDPGRFRIVSFMTDGYIGNEAQIFAAVHEKVKDARIFSFGVGTSVNRYLLEGLARLGRGAVAYIGLNEAAGDKVDLFYERMSRPALTDIEIDWGGLDVSDVYPSTIPDLFVGRPVILTGRFKRIGSGQIHVHGRMGSTTSRHTIPLPRDEALTEHAGIRSVWARWKLAELSDKEVSWPSDELKEEITQTSLQHRLLCQYTSFVAVDGTKQTDGKAVTVKVPVYVPEGVSYETTVME
ncbi:VWA domain-containing protein [Candidatus Fermentibacteria bacterium]|nr:VWA domain-containing protein [Candidatus Fermentibacteria bacterium]